MLRCGPDSCQRSLPGLHAARLPAAAVHHTWHYITYGIVQVLGVFKAAGCIVESKDADARCAQSTHLQIVAAALLAGRTRTLLQETARGERCSRDNG